ncbi:MAG: hypothetical protein ACRD96_18335, partial [Bryobacteraceae bacterium]
MKRLAPAVVLAAAALVAYQYYTAISHPLRHSRLVLHTDILNRTADNPYRYRVLAPLLAGAVLHAIAPLYA